MNFVIVGASAGLGRALAEEAAERGYDLLLVASDARDLAALTGHLRLRYSIRAESLACHFSAEREWVQPLLDAVERFGPLDGLLFPIGFSRVDDDGELDEVSVRDLVEANFLGIVCVVSHFLPLFRREGRGSIVGFGSVAAIRGRGNNVIYSAAKRALLGFFESLYHGASGTGICVQFYQMGYLETRQTFGRSLLFPVVNPRDAARAVWANLGRDIGIVFYPFFWRLIAWVLRGVPWIVYKRLRF